MLIDCPACARSYNVSRVEIGEAGRVVVCPRCDAQWFVDGEGAGASMPIAADVRTTSVSRRSAAAGPVETASPHIWPRLRSAVTVAACVLVATGLLGARERVVRLVPRTAGLYATIGLPVNVRGLEIAELASNRLDETDMTITGEIRNVAQARVGVPRLAYEIRDGAGATLATWTERTSAKSLGAGKALAFASTPRRPPPGAHSVLVRFEDAEPAPVRLARRP